ncbi:MAG: hypothetical protein U0R80_10025 [Nocardioidaceae bacterium]
MTEEPWAIPRGESERREDAEFLRWYGAWAPLDPAGVAALLEGFRRPWWLVGGWAIEAFTGRPREHEDLDISLLACDVPALRLHLGESWTPWSNDGGVLRPLSDRFPAPLAADGQLWVRRSSSDPWVLDIPLTPSVEGLWSSKRMPGHVAPVEEVTWVSGGGIRCLRPEIVLLFKGLQDRAKDRRDLEVCWPLLDAGQRSWLLESLVAAYGPEHPWLGLVG